MTLPDAAIATRLQACSACGGALDPMGRCVKCGAVFGEAYRCPLCHALSDIEPSAALTFRCRTCGGPRLPPHESSPSQAEVACLQSARGAQLRAAAFRAGSAFALASGVLSLLVTCVVLIATSPALFAQIAAFIASAVPFALAGLSFRKAQLHTRKLQGFLERAWLLATARLVQHHGPEPSAKRLAEDLRVEEPRAELLLAELSLADFVAAPAQVPAKMRVTEAADARDLPLPAPETAELPAAPKKLTQSNE